MLRPDAAVTSESLSLSLSLSLFALSSSLTSRRAFTRRWRDRAIFCPRDP